MKQRFKAGQRVYFIISGRIVTEAVVVASNSWFVTIMFKKSGDCIIRLPYHRIFLTKEEAETHIRPIMPYRPAAMTQTGQQSPVCIRNWELWE